MKNYINSFPPKKKQREVQMIVWNKEEKYLQIKSTNAFNIGTLEETLKMGSSALFSNISRYTYFIETGKSKIEFLL